MALLRGDVEILGLGNLLQLLSFNKREGVLTLEREENKKIIHFTNLGIRLLSSTMRRINKLGKILLRRKKISREDLNSLLKEQRLLGWKLGKIAVESGLVKKSDVEEALREQVEEEIFDMFMWEDASFEFAEGKSPRQDADHPLAGFTFDTNVTQLILEAARRADELLTIRKILQDDMYLARLPFDIQADEMGADLEVVEEIVPLLNSRPTVREVVAASIYPRFATLRAIHRLLVLGYIKALDRSGHTARMSQQPQERVT